MASTRNRGDSVEITVCLGYDSNGKKIRKTETYTPPPGLSEKKRQKSIDAEIIRFETILKGGKIAMNSSIKLDSFCNDIYLPAHKEFLSPDCYAMYSATIKNYIIPSLGHMKLKDIQPDNVQNFINELLIEKKIVKKVKGKEVITTKKLSVSSVDRYLDVLKSVLKYAVKLKYIAETPADKANLTMPKAVKKNIDIVTINEANHILECLEQESIQFQTMIQFALHSGCREGEIVGLKFSDFNEETLNVTIMRSAYKLTGEPTKTKPPKDYEHRIIKLNPEFFELLAMLKAEKEKEAARLGDKWLGGDEDWLFTQYNGKIMHPDTPSKQFKKFLKKYSIQHHVFHSLRHSNATLLLYGGINIKHVQERLGHSDIKTTQRYLHYIQDIDTNAATVLDTFLSKHKNKNETENSKKTSKSVG